MKDIGKIEEGLLKAIKYVSQTANYLHMEFRNNQHMINSYSNARTMLKHCVEYTSDIYPLVITNDNLKMNIDISFYRISSALYILRSRSPCEPLSPIELAVITMLITSCQGLLNDTMNEIRSIKEEDQNGE